MQMISKRALIGQPVTPLLEKERHARGDALIANGAHPVRVHGSRPRPALAADDDPMKRALRH